MLELGLFALEFFETSLYLGLSKFHLIELFIEMTFPADHLAFPFLKHMFSFEHELSF